MSIKKTIQALRNHIHEESRIHKDLLGEAKGDVKHLVKKHWADTLAIHRAFWKDLKKSLKSK